MTICLETGPASMMPIKLCHRLFWLRVVWCTNPYIVGAHIGQSAPSPARELLKLWGNLLGLILQAINKSAYRTAVYMSSCRADKIVANMKTLGWQFQIWYSPGLKRYEPVQQVTNITMSMNSNIIHFRAFSIRTEFGFFACNSSGF